MKLSKQSEKGLKAMLSKKAMSPLFGTILLISLSLFIGLVAMASGNLLLGKVREPIDEDLGYLACPGSLPFEVTKACYVSSQDSSVELYVLNSASKQLSLSNYRIRIRQQDNLDFHSSSDLISPGKAKSMIFSFDISMGIPDKISLVPIIKRDNMDYLCTENIIEYGLTECA